VGPDGVIAKVDPRAPSGVLVSEARTPWSYARVVTDEGEMAWSSPVFLAP
jgi:hypothetical protein